MPPTGLVIPKSRYSIKSWLANWKRFSRRNRITGGMCRASSSGSFDRFWMAACWPPHSNIRSRNKKLPVMKENYTQRLNRALDEYAQLKETEGQPDKAAKLRNKASSKQSLCTYHHIVWLMVCH